MEIIMSQGRLGRIIVARVKPGADVLEALKQIAIDSNIKSGVILTCVGSLNKEVLRNVKKFPPKLPVTDEQRATQVMEEPMEILAVYGDIARENGEVSVHGHIIVSSGDGAKAYGGHLIKGNIVWTTMEVIIAEILDVDMRRETCKITKAKELVV